MAVSPALVERRRLAVSLPVTATLRAAVPVGIALVLWIASLRGVDLSGMSDVGLVSVLPLPAFAALALLAVSFCHAVWRRAHAAILLVHVLALVFMLYGITALVEDVPRFAVTWRHVGIAQYIADHGAVNPLIDAYFNWPGFFSLLAFVSGAAGLGSPIALAAWAPMFFNLLYLPALLLLFSSFSRERRLVWLAVWLFYAANWIGQDYLSPQALTYFVFLVLLGILLRWFHPHPIYEQPPPRQRAALMGLAILLFAAIVPAHQLTPVAAAFAVGALVIARRTTTVWLPVLMGVLVAGWVTFMAAAYLAGHAHDVAGQAGQLHGTVAANVGNRLTGSTGHLLVVYLRLLLTGAVWSLAFLGGLRALRRDRADRACVALALAPFALMPLQPYGGEILLRVYLFSLPFMVFFVARLFFVRRDAGRGRTTLIVLIALNLVAVGAFMVARYGNERMDRFSAQDRAATHRLYAVAKPGSALVAVEDNLPWRYRGYADYDYVKVSELSQWRLLGTRRGRLPAVVAAVLHQLRERPQGGYLILTPSQAAASKLLGAPVPHAYARFASAVASSPDFRAIYRGADAVIYVARKGRR